MCVYITLNICIINYLTCKEGEKSIETYRNDRLDEISWERL